MTSSKTPVTRTWERRWWRLGGCISMRERVMGKLLLWVQMTIWAQMMWAK